jgi:hypothetical protein
MEHKCYLFYHRTHKRKLTCAASDSKSPYNQMI